MTISEPEVLIIELGGQLTQNIARVLRESARVRSAILTPDQAELWLKQNRPKAIILSGSGASVTDENAPKPPEIIFSLKRNGRPVPMLGICYGMQYLAHRFNGRVEARHSEYGEAEVTVRPGIIFRKTKSTQRVWMDHGDSVTVLPPGFIELGRSNSGALAAMANLTKNICSVQFHPEATQSEFGAQILKNFVEHAECEPNWEPSSIAGSIQQEVLDEIGDGKVALPWSGGVDSTTLVQILLEALGDRLLYFNIDGNQLRRGEPEEIKKTAKLLGGNYVLIPAHEQFGSIMIQSAEGPIKRKLFQAPYGDILMRTARQFGATHIPQGTLAPDLIESGKTGGAKIVQHHNDLKLAGFEMLHPMRHLYKYEVRALARALELPEYIWQRQPFPGPGLYIRIIGGLATPENIETVRWLDWRATEIVKRHGVYDEISQLVVGYDVTPTSGVKGNNAFSGGSAIVRPFKTHDFMTGEGYFLSEPVVRELCNELPKHPKICRTFLDYTPKPPGRTELQ